MQFGKLLPSEKKKKKVKNFRKRNKTKKNDEQKPTYLFELFLLRASVSV